MVNLLYNYYIVTLFVSVCVLCVEAVAELMDHVSRLWCLLFWVRTYLCIYHKVDTKTNEV